MRVREDNGVRMQPLKFSQPIKAAINHHFGAAIGHEQRSVHSMAARPRFDFAAGAQKGELHQER